VIDVVALPGGGAVIERLDAGVQARFRGLRFLDARLSTVKVALEGALDLLSRVAGVAALLSALVRAIHPLAAMPGWDVSHSDPGLPFSIFVSLPGGGENDRVHRLAESIFHEALHLQLTLIEATSPLVADAANPGFSPWKQEPRPLQGLLHGLYVFAAIYQLLEDLSRRTPSIALYATRRQREIRDEVEALNSMPDGLTAAGKRLWSRASAVVR
jgi:HEXXH motif-containing protein